MTDSPWQILDARDHPWSVDAVVAIQRECETDTWGNADMAVPAPVWQARLAGTPDATHLLRLAVPAHAAQPGPDDVAGFWHAHLPRSGNTHLSHTDVEVRPARRGVGTGALLLADLERALADEGRSTLITYVGAGPEPAPGPGALVAPTGNGRVAADVASSRFALAHGWTLEQVERHSVLVVPDDLAPFAAMREQALAAAGPEYRLHTWHDEIPEQWLDAMAVLFSRMVTDAPSGALAYEPEPWDAERVRRWLRWTVVDREEHVTFAVAEHVPTGVLAAHTELVWSGPDESFAFQQATLVRADHRGHRLGMAVKAANVLFTREHAPALRRIHTDNAEENAPMLAINVAMGFAPAGVYAAWQKRS
ncbi:MAG TPA: GNAT family N-acetyltransferase [Cellulomonas sp.]